MAGELLEVRIDAVALDGTTPITQLNPGQEFLLRGRAKDLRGSASGAFQVYTDINYASNEVTPVVSEVQRLDFTGDPVNGTFRLSYGGDTTAPIDFLGRFSQGQQQAKAIQDALEGIPQLAGNIRVDQDQSFNSQLPQFRYFLRFINALDEADVATVTANTSGLQTNPDNPGSPAGISITEIGKGDRADVQAFRQAFEYNGTTQGVNLAGTFFPDLRQAADVTNKFDNVGGGAPLFVPPGTGFTDYFLARMRVESGGDDNAITFSADFSGVSGLEIFLFNDSTSEALDTPQEVLFTYGANGVANRLRIPVITAVTAVSDNTYAVREDSAAAILSPSPLANDTQTPPQTPSTLTITSVSAGSGGGTLTIINGGKDVRYKPAANFFGTETFNYVASDTVGNTGTGLISIAVQGINDAPSFTKGADQTVNEDAGAQTVVNFATNISAGPLESQTLTFATSNNNVSLFTVQPTISPTGTLTFTPAPNASGTATVSVRLSDSGGTANGGVDSSAVQTFTIRVSPVNDAPTNTVPGAQATIGTSPITFTGTNKIAIADIDAGSTADLIATLTVSNGRLLLGSVPAGLVATGNNTASVTITGTITQINTALDGLRYVANGGFVGADSLRIVTNDQGNTGAGGAKTDSDTVALNVQAAALPTAINDMATVVEDSTNNVINVLSNDKVNASSSATLLSVTQPTTGGTVTIDTKGTSAKTDDVLVFTPSANVTGQVFFTYVMNDTAGTGANSTGTVTVTVTAVSDAPVAKPDAYVVNEDATLTATVAKGVLANDTDADGQTLTATVVTPPATGTLTFNSDGSFTYVPVANAHDDVFFTYLALDTQNVSSNLGRVDIRVVARPDRPTGANKTYAATEGVTLTVPAATGLLVGAADVDGDTLTAIKSSNPGKGSVTVSADGSFAYVPNAGASGTDTFRYQIVDSTNLKSLLYVATINIAGTTNDPPTAANQSYAAAEDTNLVVPAATGLLKNASDPENSPLRAIIVRSPEKGQITQLDANTGAFTYRPDANVSGTDTFTFKVNDGQLNSVVRTVTIAIAAVNDPPPVRNDAFTVLKNTANQLLPDVLANDKAAPNPDAGETLTLVGADTTTAQGGTVTRNAQGQLRYTPKAGFVGTDTFKYSVSDGTSTAQGTVTLSVTAPQLNSIAGFVYRDENGNGIKDTGEAGIGGVVVTLYPAGTQTLTDVNGRYIFTGVDAGNQRIVETQPAYLRDGLESLGSAGGTKNSDEFVITVPADGFPNHSATNYNFGELSLRLNDTSTSDAPLVLTNEEILASSSPNGAIIALDSGKREWYQTLDSSWDIAQNLSVQLSPDQQSLTVTVVVAQNGVNKTYRAVIPRSNRESENLHFRVMATNNQGFNVIRLDGDLDLSEFTLVTSLTAADRVFASQSW